MCQQCGADASGPPSACEPGSARSQALVLELSSLPRGQAQREESICSARIALAQIKLVAAPPDGPRRVGAKIVNSISCGLRRSQSLSFYHLTKQRFINALADGVNERYGWHDNASPAYRPKFRVFTEKA